VRLFELLEHRHGLAAGSLRMEIMIEITQVTASCNITAAYQTMDHPM
jgi:hypothetical protein